MGTLSPSGGSFGEEMPFGRGRNTIWARRECLPDAKEALFSTKTPLSGEGEGRLLHLSGKPGGIPDRGRIISFRSVHLPWLRQG